MIVPAIESDVAVINPVHEAFPVASETNTLPADAPLDIRTPLNDHVQRTSSVYAGTAVPIPINEPVWKSRDAKRPTHPLPKTER